MLISDFDLFSSRVCRPWLELPPGWTWCGVCSAFASPCRCCGAVLDECPECSAPMLRTIPAGLLSRWEADDTKTRNGPPGKAARSRHSLIKNEGDVW